jgi:hypothetical protein
MKPTLPGWSGEREHGAVLVPPTLFRLAGVAKSVSPAEAHTLIVERVT